MVVEFAFGTDGAGSLGIEKVDKMDGPGAGGISLARNL